ncbi:MAG: amidohydrolase family protein [Clostridiales bacterium]|nr:amidohydrolase family protein [Clostridiales bacterium]
MSLSKLIKGGHVYAPEDMGIRDVLIVNDKIAAIGEDLIPALPDTEVIDAAGKNVVPGFIDGHIHFLGGGGGGGPATRSCISHLSHYTRNGVTTAIGLLGIDRIGFTIEELLIRAMALEEEGLSTYILDGSYHIPSTTITDSLSKDLYLIDKVIGVKIAVRASLSSHLTKDDIKKVVAEAWLGGRMGGKAGVVVSHIGSDPGIPLIEIADLMDEMGIPSERFVLTHVNTDEAILQESIQCGLRGIVMDLTGNWGTLDGKAVPQAKALKKLLEAGVNPKNITMSSDAVAPFVHADRHLTVQPIGVCARAIHEMICEEKIDVPTAISVFTSNPARVYHLKGKGVLQPGMDADVLLLDDAFTVDTTIAKGQVMVRNREVQKYGVIEQSIIDSLR